jgi:hypothetical protein
LGECCSIRSTTSCDCFCGPHVPSSRGGSFRCCCWCFIAPVAGRCGNLSSESGRPRGDHHRIHHPWARTRRGERGWGVEAVAGGPPGYLPSATSPGETGITGLHPSMDSTTPILTLTYFPVIFLSGALGSLASEPRWLTDLASNLSAQPLVDAATRAPQSAPSSSFSAQDLMVLAAWAAAGLVASLMMFDGIEAAEPSAVARHRGRVRDPLVAPRLTGVDRPFTNGGRSARPGPGDGRQERSTS